MPLNFWEEGADDGTDTADSIEPIQNGEPIEEAYLNRAVENVRKRTEDVRKSADYLELIERSDRVISLFTQMDTYVFLQEPSAGEFRFYLNTTGTAGGGYDRDLYVIPMLTPSRSNSGAAHNVAARFFYDAGGGNGLVVNVDAYSGAPRRVVHGAHNIYLQIIDDDAISGTPVVEIKATNPGAPDPEDGPVYIIVKIEDGVTTLTQIDTAIDASAAASLVTASVVGTGSTAVDTSGTPWGPYRAYETDAGAVGEGAQAGVDEEGFTIPASALNTFFVTNGERLKDGDTLFLDFDSAKTRMETIPATTLTAANLHIVSADERAVTDARNLGDSHGPIPICKLVKLSTGPDVFGLIFANGKIFEVGRAEYFNISYKSTDIDVLRIELATTAGSPYGDYMIGTEAKSATTGTTFDLSSGTLNSQLKSILNQLADNTIGGPNGAEVVGAYGKTGSGGATFTLPTGSVASQLQSILDQLTDSVTSPSGDEKIGAPIKNSASGVSFDLAAGTIKSQLQSIIDQLASATVSDSGDLKVGAEAKTTAGGTGWGLASGSINSQLQEIADELSKNTATAGAAQIGARAQAGTNFSVSTGSIDSQIGNLLTDLDNHVAGTGRHDFTDIDAAPFWTVDPGGGANYSTIQAALNAVSVSVGASILVKAGTYNESLVFPSNLEAPIRLIAWGGYVDINPTSPNPAFTFDGLISTATSTGQVSILGFSMMDGQITIPNYVEFSGTAFHPQCWVVFQNCLLGRTAQAANHLFEFDANVNVRLENCVLDGYSTNTGTAATDPFMKILTGAAPRVEVLKCHIRKCAQFITYDDHSTAALGSLRVDGCTFNWCGFTDNVDGDPSIAIISQDNILDTIEAQITNNGWLENTSTTEECGAFCRINGSGVVGNNALLQGFEYTPTGTALYLVEAIGMLVTGNHIKAGLGRAIYGMSVIGNYIEDYDDRTSGPGISAAGNGHITNNRIVCAATVTSDAVIDSGWQRVTIQGNTIYETPGDIIGIYVGDVHCVVSDNVVYHAGNLSTAIKVEANYCTIKGNAIYRGDVGIHMAAGSSYGAVSGNAIFDTVTCIQIDAAYSAVTGNSITDSATGGTGVDVNASYVAVTGNMIDDKSFGVHLGENNACCVSGNMINGCSTGVFVDGDNNAVSANAIYHSGNLVTVGSNATYTAIAANAFNNAASPKVTDSGSNTGIEFESGAGYSVKYNNPQG